jgi:hypothetical protein
MFDPGEIDCTGFINEESGSARLNQPLSNKCPFQQDMETVTPFKVTIFAQFFDI